MKNIIILIIILVIIGAVIFYPKKVSLGGGMPVSGQVQHYQKCEGFYVETYNDNSKDGDRGGLCFGFVKEY